MLRLIWLITLMLPLFFVVEKLHAEIRPIQEILRLDNASGLRSQKAYSILEDEYGAVWIGTKAGVNRYNGRTLKNYTLTGDVYSFEDMAGAGRIVRLYHNNGDLYAYDTSGKIYLYSKVFDRFDVILQLSEHTNGDALNKYIQTSDGCELFAMNDGLYMRRDHESVKPIIPNITVNELLLADDKVFVGTVSGLKILNRDRTISDVNSLQGLNIISLYHDVRNNRIYAGTFDRGLWVLDLSDLTSCQVHPESELLSKPIRSVIELTPDDIVVGVDGNGVLSLDKNNNQLNVLVNTDINPDFAFVGNGIYALNTDSSGNLWIGSYTGGVTMISFSSYPIQVLIHRMEGNNSLANNNVNAIIENSDGSIWYATDSGISIADARSASWRHVLENEVIVTMCQTSNGEVLAGCYGEGLYLLDKSGNIKKHWTQRDGTLPYDYIFTVKVDSQGNIWIGSPHGALTVIDSDSHNMRQFLIDKILSINVLENGNVCVGTVNGFYIVNQQKDSFNWYANQREHDGQDINSYIIPTLFNSDSTVWLGTEGGGLMLYDIPDRRIVKKYKVADGLPSNDIYSLQKDASGRLWVGTGNGIAIVDDTVASSLNYINGVAREYNKLSSTQLASGDLIFGGTAGAVRFSPEKISAIDYSAKLRITGFYIEGITDEQNMELLPSIKKMIDDRHIILAYDHNSFQLDYEAINIQFRDDISYRYILDGYDKEWSDISFDETARFRNLPSGNYILKIQALRKSDGRVLDSQTIQISVKNPWWNTFWAWMIYVIIIGWVVYLLIRYKWYQLRKRHDEDKIRFFINTAHDIKTPLSLIMAPIEELGRQDGLPDKSQYLLEIAGNNIRKLNAVTAQLLDFEKIDTKKSTVKFEPLNLNYLLSEEVSCFRNVCDKKDVRLTLDVPEESVVISADRHLMELMLDNLLSNACKYTPRGGNVDICLYANKNKVHISVSDDGIGIPAKEQRNIFTNVYRAENARATQEAGNGFGLLQVKRIVDLLKGRISFKSKEGQGTVFTISFKRIYDAPAIQWNSGNMTSSVDEIRTYSVPASCLPTDKNETLLIVEDNDDLRNYLASTFKAEYNVVTTSSADDALKFLENHYSDIILSDVMMPGIQGDEFCKIVKGNPATAGIPVILLTAKTNHDAIVEGIEKGADDYISKPFSLDILKTKIKGMLNNRKRIRDFLLNQAVKKVETQESIPQPDFTTVHPAEDSLSQTPDITMSESDCAFVDKATNIILSNISDAEFDIEALCREMAMSRTLFFSRLKSLTGKGPQEFIRILRLEKASELLKSGISVSEACEKTGFANSKYFSTVFKKYFGVSPSKYNE